MNRNLIFISLLAALTALPAEALAQNRRRTTARRARPAATKPKETHTPQQLMAAYRFAEAATALQHALRTAAQGSPEAQALQRQLQEAQAGERMLSGTAQVVVVDSVMVPRSRVLQAIPLSPECGRLQAGGQGMPYGAGSVGYLPALGDRVLFAAPDARGTEKLNMAYRIGQDWGRPTPLPGLATRNERQQTPVLNTDGTTLYYSASGAESLGGLDIFITTYDNDSRQYMQPENLGMPFNSPAADYLYVVDEEHALGWFASERHGLRDSVCVYTFIPPTTRQVYDEATVGAEQLRRLARIASIKDTWTGHEAQVQAARERLAKLRARPATQAPTAGGAEGWRFVVSDARVCTRLEDFRQPRARQLAAQWVESNRILAEARRRLDEQRRAYAAAPAQQRARLAAALTTAEGDAEQLAAKTERLTNEIRAIETKQ